MRTPSSSNLRGQARNHGALDPMELAAAFDHLLSTAVGVRPSPQLFSSLYNNSLNPSTVLPESGPAKTASEIRPEDYTQPFLSFISENPTVFHAVKYFSSRLDSEGFTKLSERESWTSALQPGGKYYSTRNGSALVAFAVPQSYKPGNGIAMCVGHIDALTAKLKPVSTKPTVEGYLQLGVAPYAGAMNSTWWDRDLGIGGRVVVKNTNGSIETKLVKLGWPIAKIPTLAPHFGAAASGPFNQETQMTPIIGLESQGDTLAVPPGTFAATQPPRLVKAISRELGITDYSSILNWELELYDYVPGQLLGLDKEFISAPRIDDKLCSYSALEGLIEAARDLKSGGTISLVGLFDDEEVGSRLRQGAASNYLPSTVERIVEAFSAEGKAGANAVGSTYANSFLVSADVTHAVNPNFMNAYLADHMPKLNVGLTVSADSNAHMTTDAVSTAFMQRVANKSNAKLQVFQIRNDSRSGGTVGPMLSTAMGVRAIDVGLPQLSMHSLRATTGALDPGLGVQIFKGFFEHFEAVDAEFTE